MAANNRGPIEERVGIVETEVEGLVRSVDEIKRTVDAGFKKIFERFEGLTQVANEGVHARGMVRTSTLIAVGSLTAAVVGVLLSVIGVVGGLVREPIIQAIDINAKDIREVSSSSSRERKENVKGLQKQIDGLAGDVGYLKTRQAEFTEKLGEHETQTQALAASVNHDMDIKWALINLTRKECGLEPADPIAHRFELKRHD